MTRSRRPCALSPDVKPAIAELQARRELLALAVSRQIRCVGSIQRDKDGASVPRFVRQPGGEIWTVAVTATGVAPTFRIAGQIRRDGTFRPEDGAEAELVPGQLLLAPADGQDTRALRDRFRAIEGLRATDAWPTNAWE